MCLQIAVANSSKYRAYHLRKQNRDKVRQEPNRPSPNILSNVLAVCVSLSLPQHLSLRRCLTKLNWIEVEGDPDKG